MTQIAKHRRRARSGAATLLFWIFGSSALTPVAGDPKFPNKNKNLLYVPFSVVPLATHPRAEGGPIRIISVGKFQARKNQVLLLEAVYRLRGRYDVRLTLSGEENEPAYLEKIRSYIREYKLEDVVTIVPHRPWREMAALYGASDLFVLPSSGEPAAYSLLEAMAAGLPVVSSDDNGTASYIVPGRNGFIFQHDDLDDLTAVLDRLLSHPEALRHFGEESLALVKERHDPAIFYQALMAASAKKC